MLEPETESANGSDDVKIAKEGVNLPVLILTLLAALLFIGASYFGFVLLNRFEEMEAQLQRVGQKVDEANEQSERALKRAEEAEASSREAARGRARAESEAESAHRNAADARVQADAAEADAETAREEAKLAREEADRIKREWDKEVDRLHESLSKIVETRKTALGLVMNLSEDYLKFDFDKAELRAENRELLSRIAGILLTSKDYSVSVYGHTDDVGTEDYNQNLSERRARAVRDYLVEAGLDAAIVTTEGLGESQPLVPETTDVARAKNRRVEIGIINTRIKYVR
jgi:outer membrane protein OmpA-like peptidoglycan-associated protein